jgi:hypothetical protein
LRPVRVEDSASAIMRAIYTKGVRMQASVSAAVFLSQFAYRFLESVIVLRDVRLFSLGLRQEGGFGHNPAP